MLHIKNLDEGLPVFKALASEIRVRIVKLLLDNGEMNMNELAAALGVTNGALTSHVRMLEESGLLSVVTESGGHGNQKLCRVRQEKILVDVVSELKEDLGNVYYTEIPVGHYVGYEIYPTCGIATGNYLIGEVDDPRYFAHADRMYAEILWFGKGYVEYLVPTLLPPATRIDQISLSMEISSEAPGVNNDWPSDISFYLNDVYIGMWTSPGDFGDVQGIFTPDWWFPNWNQYGQLKLIVIDSTGTYLDGLKISDVTIDRFRLDYKSTVKFRFEVAADAANVGGFTIFGKKFGNYNQAIKVRINYSPIGGGEGAPGAV